MDRKIAMLAIAIVGINVYAQRIGLTIEGNYFTNPEKYEVVDTCEYQVYYSFKCVLDTTFKVINVPVKDVCILQIGKQVSKTYSQSVYEMDSIDHALIKQGAEAVPTLEAPVIPVEVFMGYPRSKMTVTYLTLSPDFVFRYSELEPKQTWIVGTSKKKILGYDCTEATCNYRGRDYEAWFTTAIPLEDGPWMFGGLPGLILAIHDTKNQYVFQCTGISQKQEPIKMFERTYKVGSRETIRKAIDRMYDKPVNYKPRWYVMSRKDHVIKPMTDMYYMPYNPIELK